MTKCKDPHVPEHVKEAWASLSEADKREAWLIGVIKDALEDALAETHNGKLVCTLDIREIVTVHRRSIALFMSMSKHFDDPENVLKFVLGEFAPALIEDMISCRKAMRALSDKPPDNVLIIEENDLDNSGNNPNRPN